MPKNGHHGAKKPNVPFASNNEDIDSNVVFGNVKTPKNASQGSTAEGSLKKGEDNMPASSEGPPKKTDTRKLVSNIAKLSECYQDDLNDMIGKRSTPSKFLSAQILSLEVALTPSAYR